MIIFRTALAPAILLLLLLMALVLGGPGNRLDEFALRALASIRFDSPRLTSVAIMVTHAGSAYATLGLGLFAALYLLIAGGRGRALLLIVSIAGERMIVDGLKLLIDRPRPAFDLHPVVTSSSAFPSGHAANSMAAFLMVALIAAPPRFRGPAVMAAIILSLAVGATRPYLGVHWPSDVIGGWSLGLLAAWIALQIGKRSGVLPVEAQHDVVGGHVAKIDQR